MKITEKQNLLKLLGFLGIVLVVGFVVSTGIGFVARGFDTQEVINTFAIYGLFLVVGLFMFGISKFIEWIDKRGDKKYGEGLMFSSQGMKPGSSFWGRFSNFQLFHISLIIFGFLGLLVSRFKQTSFTAFPIIEQQFTETGSVLFTTFLVPIAENMYFLGVISLILIGMRSLARKNNWSFSDYNIASIIILFVAGGLLQLGYHSLRYSGSDVGLITVFVFWGVGALMSYFTQSFVPFWVLHLVNNLVYDLKRFFSSDTITTIFGAVLVFLFILYFIIWSDKLTGDPNRV